jgi:predicted DCC family thiol-disulfide oxidoreductase YuxK
MENEAQPRDRDIVFYDGDCALCHGFVRFLLNRDAAGNRFVYSPLAGQLIGRLLTAEERAALPDSLVLRTAQGRLLTRSDAVIAMLDRLGGFWGLLATLGRVFPRGVRDAVYDGVARVRRRIFGTTAYSCPLVPAALRDRFLD